MEAWIKVCVSTPRNPKLSAMARVMGVSRATVLGHCIDLWTWADSQTADGFISGVTFADIVEAAGVPMDFCRAMASEEIHWMWETLAGDERGSGVLLHNWQHHNGTCTKKRSQEATRQSRCRGRAAKLSR